MQQHFLPAALYNVAQIRLLEQQVLNKTALEDNELMERAGFAVFHTLQETWPAARHIAVVTGPGNNGGDGFIVARLAHQAGLAVRVLTTADPATLKDPAKKAFEAAQESGVLICAWNAEHLAMTDVIVDALFGIGVQRKIDAQYVDIIEAINAEKIPVLAIDVPSGLCANTGRMWGTAVRAMVTVTFMGMKCGLCTGLAAEYAGEIIFSDLGVTDNLERIQPAALRIETQKISQILTTRSRIAHKGDFGHILIIGGDYGYAGAVSMAASAALRVGAGLVSVATRAEHIAPLVAQHPEIMAHGVQTAEDLEKLIAQATVIVLGPGLGRSEWSQALWLKAVVTHLPMVVDADGLNWLAEDPHISNEWILTPHPGEAARLLKTQTERVQLDRFAAAADLQHQYGGIAILKGNGTLVQMSNTSPFVCMAGNPGMATGGMGDILSGIIGGLIAQKLSLADAAQIGVLVHALAGDLAAREGERGMLATDLLPYIRQLINPQY